MGLRRFALFACTATAGVQPVIATSPAPLGRFGVWEAWASPPMLQPVGQPPGEMAATISAYGKNVRWSVDVLAKGYMIFIQDRHCHERTFLPVRGASSTTIVNTLKKQTEAARRCSGRAGFEPIERMGFSRSDLQRALLRVRPLGHPQRSS